MGVVKPRATSPHALPVQQNNLDDEMTLDKNLKAISKQVTQLKNKASGLHQMGEVTNRKM
jgi:hypothetical protein